MKEAGIELGGMAELERTVAACRLSYRCYPNVLEVAAGLKQTAGKIDPSTCCVQFYVVRKLDISGNGRLPAFVYARRADGTVDRQRRLPTDVLELGRIEFVCRAGDPVEALGECGAAALVFENKHPGLAGTCVLTCAHVAGDVERSPPVDDRLLLSRSRGGPIVARTVTNAIQRGATLDYDIAVALIDGRHRGVHDLMVSGSSHILRSFLASAELRPGVCLSTAFPRSNILSTSLLSSRLVLPIELDGRMYGVRNLFLIDRMPQYGDSGGLLYRDSAAAGILVARCSQGGLFQPLGEAFSYVRDVLSFPIECFHGRQQPGRRRVAVASAPRQHEKRV